MSLDETSNRGEADAEANDLRFDDAAFKIFFRQYFVQLCAYCQYKFGFDIDLSKDIVQAGFLKLWETRHAIVPGLSLKAYLYKIITNLSLDTLRHRKVERTSTRNILRDVPESGTGDSFQHADFKQLKAAVETAVAELPEQMRKVFELCRYEGMKYAEVARHLDISIKTVETQMSRAMARLRQRLAEHLVVFLAVVLAALLSTIH